MKHISYSKTPKISDAIYDIRLRLSYTGKDDQGNPTYNSDYVYPKLTFEGTVKLHGTNASVVYDNGNIYAQSRENVLSINNDNAGFCFWVENNKEFLNDLFKEIQNKYRIEPENKIVIFGEWAGKGIQKNVAINKIDKSFFVFGIKIIDAYITKIENDIEVPTSYWIDFKDLRFPNIKNMYNIFEFTTYSVEIDLNNPKEVEDILNEITDQVEKECPVAKHFGISGLGEGVVWTTLLTINGNTSKLKFKTKGKKHQEVNKEGKNITIDEVKLGSIQDFIEYAVTENRVRNGINILFGNERPDIKRMGDFMKWIINDVITEEGKELYKNNLEVKDVNKYISNKARDLFLKIQSEFI